ncbi:MAG: biotin--[acetyl-CoA-carboxylase] ligase [Chloroflexi bacterium]|nr:biotin--[acetyl-CoA-carboxylase] ligase [Chloroflexota bacterium]
MNTSLAVRRVRDRLRGHRWGARILYLPVCTSTMDVLREEAEQGATEGTVVVAEEQTSGRGRLGRRWLSVPGQSLTFSLLLYPPAAVGAALGIAASVATLRAIREVTGLGAAVKWPNDILVGGKKVAGILIEGAWQGGRLRYAIVGIGVNVNAGPAEDSEVAATATSLAHQLGRAVSREDLLVALLRAFREVYDPLVGWFAVWHEWQAALVGLGQEMRVQYGDQVEEGVAEGVDLEGSLLLRRPDGTLVPVTAGDITLGA